jgi:hypothetical protein
LGWTERRARRTFTRVRILYQNNLCVTPLFCISFELKQLMVLVSPMRVYRPQPDIGARGIIEILVRLELRQSVIDRTLAIRS